MEDQNTKRTLGLLICLFLMVGCSTSRNLSAPRNGSRPHKTVTRDKDTRLREDVVTYAKRFIGTPYRNKGRTPAGFDCSGLTTHVYRHFSVPLEATSSGQSRMGTYVEMKEVRPGDLVFFGKGSIHHVGIVSRANSREVFMIHSSSSQGVIETEIFSSRYWSARLRFARRVL